MQTIHRSLSIATDLRPDYYEYFPNFEDIDLWHRLKFLPLHSVAMMKVSHFSRLALQFDRADEIKRLFSRPMIEQRALLIEVLKRVGISTRTLLGISKVDREHFCSTEMHKLAYCNESMHFDFLSCVSPPGLIALMIDRLNIEKGQRFLEIGIGSGYHAACIYESLERECDIIGIEFNPHYCLFGRQVLERLGYSTIHIHEGDALGELSFNNLFDRIYITASFFDGYPVSLCKHLREGGIIQYARALSEKEFSSESMDSWLKRTYVDYTHYTNGNWRQFCCLATAVKHGDIMTEVDCLYDVTFTPLHNEISSYVPYAPSHFDHLLALISSDA